MQFQIMYITGNSHEQKIYINDTNLYCVTSYYNILYYITLHYIILYYIILYYVILNYIIL